MTDHPADSPVATTDPAGSPAPLRHPAELALLVPCLIFCLPLYVLILAGLAWLALRAPDMRIPLAATLAVTGLAVWLASFLARIFYLAHIRGNGLLVSDAQLPHVREAVARAAAALGVREPRVYVIQFGGLREATVRLLLGRRYLILSSRLLDDCGDGKEREMLIGRELGYLRFHHYFWQALALPAAILPLLYAAYRRATEYTADRCGLAACGDFAAARRALFILAAGGRLAPQVNPERYHDDVGASGGFWMTMAHLTSWRPMLAWRSGRLLRAARGAAATAALPRRSLLAQALSFFIPSAASHAGSLGLIGIVVLGLVAALAVPSFLRARVVAGRARAEYGQRRAVDSLRTILTGQMYFHGDDSDGNQTYDYAADFSDLYYTQKNGEGISLIDKALADADDDGDGAVPKGGYLFADIPMNENGQPYDRAYECAICAWPARYGVTGRLTFVIDVSGAVYCKDLGERTGPLTQYPEIADWLLEE